MDPKASDMSKAEYRDAIRARGMRPDMIEDMGHALRKNLINQVSQALDLHQAGGLSPNESVGAITSAFIGFHEQILTLIFALGSKNSSAAVINALRLDLDQTFERAADKANAYRVSE